MPRACPPVPGGVIRSHSFGDICRVACFKLSVLVQWTFYSITRRMCNLIAAFNAFFYRNTFDEPRPLPYLSKLRVLLFSYKELKNCGCPLVGVL